MAFDRFSLENGQASLRLVLSTPFPYFVLENKAAQFMTNLRKVLDIRHLTGETGCINLDGIIH
jgi:hypothetical protein